MRRVIEPKAPTASRDMQRDDWPAIVLRPAGDGRAVVRAVVEILVRRALVAEGALPLAEPVPEADDLAIAGR